MKIPGHNQKLKWSASLYQENVERFEAYSPSPPEPEHISKFKTEWHNENFRVSKMTWFSFGVLILFCAQGLAGDQTDLLKNLDEFLKIFTFAATIVLQWLIFVMLYYTVDREQTYLKGIGLVKLRGIDFATGIALLLVMFVSASGLGWLLTQIGLEPKGEIALLLPESLTGKLIWVLMSFTAGMCEEVIFRGYLMTRLRLLFKAKSWFWPVIISSVAFAFPHLYQGTGNVIVIFMVGVLFAVTFIKTRSLWPCVLAHFFLDFLALFIPQ